MTVTRVRSWGFLGILALVLAPATATAQNVLLEGGVRAADLWCFPLVSDPLEYRYVPDRAALATDDEGRPQFSFVRYIINEPTTGSTELVAGAGGGGVLTFLISYGVSDARRTAAQRDLARLTGQRDAVLSGPLVFDSGNFSLVSSVLSEGRGSRAVLTTGRAPVLEGNRIALSFELDPERATLLLESFQSATPDVSLVFDMAFTAISPAFDADLVVNWSKVHQHRGFSAGGSIFWVGADVEAVFDEMRRDNSIELRTRGSDENMEALLSAVYDRLLKLMFEPVQPMELPADQKGGLFQALGKLAQPEKLADLARETTGVGLGVGYTARKIRESGRTVLSFNHQAALERHATIAFNIGDLYRRLGDEPAYFRTVNLGDPAFEQREIRVGVDGALLPELDSFVNSVGVTLEKAHEDGSKTLREVFLDGRTFAGAPPNLRLVYGWSGDEDRDRWYGYRYRTHWSFREGGSYDTGWVDSKENFINLYAPYRRRSIELLGDAEALRERGVRAVVVELSYPFFGDRRRQQRILRLDQPLADAAIELTLPRDDSSYDYRLTWHLAGGGSRTISGSATSELVFFDEMPEETG